MTLSFNEYIAKYVTEFIIRRINIPEYSSPEPVLSNQSNNKSVTSLFPFKMIFYNLDWE